MIQTNMKNTNNIPEQKIAICEKFLKDMSRLMHMENNDTKEQDKTQYMMSQVEQMIVEIQNQYSYLAN